MEPFISIKNQKGLAVLCFGLKSDRNRSKELVFLSGLQQVGLHPH